MTPSEEKYWSRTEYLKRIHWWNDDIKLCQKGRCNFNSNLVKILIQSRKFHTLAFKTMQRS